MHVGERLFRNDQKVTLSRVPETYTYVDVYQTGQGGGEIDILVQPSTQQRHSIKDNTMKTIWTDQRTEKN